MTIATRHETQISKAPSIVTVITAEEIKNLGYRTFVEILKSGDTGVVVPAVRGITSSNKVRLMLNGHFVNSSFTGSAFGRFDDFPVENIKKIEIIRGPGSAMYGENAFTAVINIITKDAKDIDGVKVSSGYGSFETYEENVVFGKTTGKWISQACCITGRPVVLTALLKVIDKRYLTTTFLRLGILQFRRRQGPYMTAGRNMT